jgi:hypothetical protein
LVKQHEHDEIPLFAGHSQNRNRPTNPPCALCVRAKRRAEI